MTAKKERKPQYRLLPDSIRVFIDDAVAATVEEGSVLFENIELRAEEFDEFYVAVKEALKQVKSG